LKIENQESLSAANVAATFVVIPPFAFGGRDRVAKYAQVALKVPRGSWP
jgi:hypothetical protein